MFYATEKLLKQTHALVCIAKRSPKKTHFNACRGTLFSYPLPMEGSALVILSLWGLNNVDLQQITGKL